MSILNIKEQHIIKQIDAFKNKAHQIAILTALLMDEETWVAKPLAEENFTFENTTYRFDLFYPDLKWAIEIDEWQHLNEDQKELDKAQDLATKKLGIETTRIDITKEGFSYTSAVKELKKQLFEKISNVNEFKEWKDVYFEVDTALKDHSNIIFISKGNKGDIFPSFKLKKDFHSIKNATVVVLEPSENSFKSSKVKSVSGVYNLAWLKPISAESGYVNWSGNSIYNSIIQSGDTITNLSSGPIHNLK
jgi:hypothetical protein